MSNRTIDRLTPEGKRLLRQLKKLSQHKVRIGYQAGRVTQEVTDSEGNVTATVDICDIAAWNELGTSTIPSRPFLRKSVDDNKDKIARFARSLKKDVQNGVPPEAILTKIGLFQKRLIQQKIDEGTAAFKPNAPSTIAAKKRKGKWNKKPVGEPKPLVDEGTMRKSVNFVIEKR